MARRTKLIFWCKKMRYYEIISEDKPMTPKQARARAKKQQRANNTLRDVKAMNAIRLRKARERTLNAY
jgi:hypothetical protein